MVENTVGKGEIAHYVFFKILILQTPINQGLFRKGLTLYQTILTFNNPLEEDFGKHCGKRRKCW